MLYTQQLTLSVVSNPYMNENIVSCVVYLLGTQSNTEVKAVQSLD